MSVAITLVGGLRKIVVNSGDAYFVSHEDKQLIPQYTGDKVVIPLFGSQALDFNELSVDGDIPTNATEFEALWALVFPDANSGNGGTGNFAGLGFEPVDTFADISEETTERLIRVDADETNNGDKSLYLHDGTTILFLQTIA